MAKKKIILSQDAIVEYYTDFVLTYGEAPKSVFSFAKANNFEEVAFYKYFGSFEAIEQQVFSMLYESTIAIIEASEEYILYNAKEKLLAFYYTFFENLTANRSLIKYLLENKNNLKRLELLKDFRTKFYMFIDGLDLQTLDLKQEKLNKFQQGALKEAAWGQLLLTIKFWLEDTSAGFEKTDIFIEKSVNTSFELMNIKPLKSLIDFGKFVFQEKSGMFQKTTTK